MKLFSINFNNPPFSRHLGFFRCWMRWLESRTRELGVGQNQLKSIPYLLPKRFKNHILRGRTYLYSSCKGEPLSPPAECRLYKCIFDGGCFPPHPQLWFEFPDRQFPSGTTFFIISRPWYAQILSSFFAWISVPFYFARRIFFEYLSRMPVPFSEI